MKKKIKKITAQLFFTTIIIIAFTGTFFVQKATAVKPPNTPCGSVCYMVYHETCTYMENGEIIVCGGWYL
jgi:hypothetical protein